MSEVAGRIAVQAAASILEKQNGGAGRLLAGVPGVEPCRVVVVGGGVVGLNSVMIAAGMGAEVYVLDRDVARLRDLSLAYGNAVRTRLGSTVNLEQLVPDADVAIGSVLVRGAKTPHIISRAQLALVKPDAVLVDVAIDQGGCFETSRPTTHDDPVFEEQGVRHYQPVAASADLPYVPATELAEALAGA